MQPIPVLEVDWEPTAEELSEIWSKAEQTCLDCASLVEEKDFIFGMVDLAWLHFAKAKRFFGEGQNLFWKAIDSTWPHLLERYGDSNTAKTILDDEVMPLFGRRLAALKAEKKADKLAALARAGSTPKKKPIARKLTAKERRERQRAESEKTIGIQFPIALGNVNTGRSGPPITTVKWDNIQFPPTPVMPTQMIMPGVAFDGLNKHSDVKPLECQKRRGIRRAPLQVRFR